MKQGHIDHGVANHHARHPVMTGATALSILILSAFALAEAALAQTNPPPGVQRKLQPEPDPRFEAPVGHRQPRPSDLPPSIQRDERRGPTADERAFDQKLKICKDC